MGSPMGNPKPGSTRALPRRALTFFLSGLIPGLLFSAAPDATSIIQRSAEVLQMDWRAAPTYDYLERDLNNHGSRTWQVMMILGSPYRRLEAVGGTPLSASDQEREAQKLKAAVAQRCGESDRQRQQRIQEYQKGRQRDHRLMEQLASAFLFKTIGQERMGGHMTWLLAATPKPGYQPTDKQTKLLTGMQGMLWVDQATFQWVKVEAFVIHPVSVEGFLARVEPGTEFQLEKDPVSGGVWLPSHFSVQSKARVLGFIGYKTHDDETYFDYQKANQVEPPVCPAPPVNFSAADP